MVSVTSSMDTRLEYTIYTDMQRHRQMVCHKQDGVIINKLIAEFLKSAGELSGEMYMISHKRAQRRQKRTEASVARAGVSAGAV
jgi:hypothetical protein